MFFDMDALHFRAWVVPDKSILGMVSFARRMMIWLLQDVLQHAEVIIRPGTIYHIYLDLKDTRSAGISSEAARGVANANYDFSGRSSRGCSTCIRTMSVAAAVATCSSAPVVSYSARGLRTSPAKATLLDLIRRRSGLSLTRSTLPSATKLTSALAAEPEGP
jgi:hypothetical protein